MIGGGGEFYGPVFENDAKGLMRMRGRINKKCVFAVRFNGPSARILMGHGLVTESVDFAVGVAVVGQMIWHVAAEACGGGVWQRETRTISIIYKRFRDFL